MARNEGKACDAVIRVYETQLGVTRSRVRLPERDGGGSPVEVVVTLGEQTHALEHTEIEAFEAQKRTGQQFGELMDTVRKELSGKLPKPGVYYVTFPTDTRIRGMKLEVAKDRICQSLREAAQRLHDRHPARLPRDVEPHGYTEEVELGVPDIPYTIKLQRKVHWAARDQRHEGILLPARFAPPDVEMKRAARIAAALNKKSTKLNKWKEGGARSVLVLEDGDAALTNYVVVSEALVNALKNRTDVPDDIWLVTTSGEPWQVRRLKCGDELALPEIYDEFEEGLLTDVMATPADECL